MCSYPNEPNLMDKIFNCYMFFCLFSYKEARMSFNALIFILWITLIKYFCKIHRCRMPFRFVGKETLYLLFTSPLLRLLSWNWWWWAEKCIKTIRGSLARLQVRQILQKNETWNMYGHSSVSWSSFLSYWEYFEVEMLYNVTGWTDGQINTHKKVSVA